MPTWSVETIAPTTGSLPRAASPAQAVTQTLAGLDSSDFESVSVGQPPSGATNRTGLWMYATIAAPSFANGGYQASMWEAMLAEGAIADRLAGPSTNLADVVSGSTIDLDAPDLSTPEDVGGGMGDAPSGQIFKAQTLGLTDQQITSAAGVTLRSFGLAGSDIRVLHPLGPALSVVATTNDITRLSGQFDALAAALNPSGMYEGLYLQIDDASGSPLVRSGGANRAAASDLWCAPGVADTLGITMGHTPGA